MLLLTPAFDLPLSLALWVRVCPLQQAKEGPPQLCDCVAFAYFD